MKSYDIFDFMLDTFIAVVLHLCERVKGYLLGKMSWDFSEQLSGTSSHTLERG